MADDDMERMHREADLKANGLSGKPFGGAHLKEGFSNHALIHQHTPDAGVSHSLGYRDNIRKGDIARGLLGTTEKPKPFAFDEARPLIDILQEGTFGDPPGLHYVADKYALRMLLRKAHCFRLDAETSAMAIDFGLAAAADLEAVRHLAIPPFPVTWFEVDNLARLRRCKERGLQLTETAARDDVCTRVGWLIHPAGDLHMGGYYATYCTITLEGPTVAPLSYFWHPHNHDRQEEERMRSWTNSDHEIQRICFGMHQSNVGRLDAFPSTTPFHLYHERAGQHGGHVKGLMYELSGELRTIWGLLLALGAGHLGAQSSHAPQALPAGPHPIGKGKPILPLEHKVLTIKLAKRMTVEKVAARAISGAKKRWHSVRGHFRTKYNADGSVKWRIHIDAHERGDERLGRIEKTYRVEK
jgi:hypothetical protein